MMNEYLQRKTMGLLLAGSILLSGAAGFGGGLLASALNPQIEAGVTSLSVQTTADSQTASTTKSSGDQSITLKTATGTTNNSTALSVAEIANMAAPAVVEITTEVLVSGTRMQQYVAEGAGSGIILSEDGLIVTNNHVIEDAEKITVRLSTGEEFAAALVGTDVKTDLAILKIEASGLTAASLGDSGSLVVGDLAVAIGNPLGELGGTVTNGIISALDREITIDDETMYLLQTNAAINPGNSGGGLFNDAGQLIGIVNAKSSGTDVEGLGFAIPINIAKPIIEQLINYGYVQGRIDLGMTLVEINTEQTAMMYRVSRLGLYVLQVTSGSATEAAGFTSGDCILTVEGTEITTSAELNTIIDKHDIGDTLKVTVYRNRQTIALTLTLAESKPTE